MANVLNISEAASLALHSMALLANTTGEWTSTRTIASTLNVSEAHLSKVLQRLGRQGLVRSTRGPGGGFALARPPHDVTLLEIFETIEGPISPAPCLLGVPVCSGQCCILGGLLDSVNRQVRDYLAGTRLSDLAGLGRAATPEASAP